MNPVQYYDRELRRLAHPWRQKIMRILSAGCVHRTNEWTFHILPIPGYNRSPDGHYVNQSPDGSWHCDCQGYATRIKRGLSPDCSHIQACRLWMQYYDHAQGRLFAEAI